MNEKIDLNNIDNLSESPWSSCSFCDKYIPRKKIRCCDSFPDGIPEEIWNGKHKHKEPYPGDNGIVFGKYFTNMILPF